MNKIESYFRIILCTSFHFASIHEVDSFLTTLNSHIQRISIIRQRKDKRIICIKIHCTDNGEIDNIRIFPCTVNAVRPSGTSEDSDSLSFHGLLVTHS